MRITINKPYIHVLSSKNLQFSSQITALKDQLLCMARIAALRSLFPRSCPAQLTLPYTLLSRRFTVKSPQVSSVSAISVTEKEKFTTADMPDVMPDFSQWDIETALPEHLKTRLKEVRSNSSTLDSDSTAIELLLIFLNIIRQLKSTERTGWLHFNIPRAESIADHMYRMSIIAMTVKGGLDTGKMMQIALAHDMAEALVGDITPRDNVDKQEKHRREELAIEYIVSLVKDYNPQAAEEILESWKQYEYQMSPEAKIVKDIDKFEMMVQAFEYEMESVVRYNKQKELGVIDESLVVHLDEFFDSRSAVKSEQICQLADRLLERRKSFWETYRCQSGK